MKIINLTLSIAILFIGVNGSFGQGQDCANAVNITAGTHSAPTQPYWYSYTSPSDERIIISSYPSSVNTYLNVYDACAGNLIDANDDMGFFGGYEESFLALELNAGQTIYLEWKNQYSTAGFDWELYQVAKPDFSIATPPDDQLGVGIDVEQFVLPFDKSIEPGFGRIELYRRSDGERIFSSRPYIVGNNLIVDNFGRLLESNTEYYILMGISVALDSKLINGYPTTSAAPIAAELGDINDPEIWNFATSDQDLKAPGVKVFQPAIGETNVSLNVTPKLSFNEPIQLGSNPVASVFEFGSNALVQDIDLTVNATVADNVLEIDLDPLDHSTTYLYANWSQRH